MPSDRVVRDGHRLFQDDRVERIEDARTYRVRSGENSYWVTLSTNDIAGLCNCPADPDIICKHLIAAGLTLDKEERAAGTPREQAWKNASSALRDLKDLLEDEAAPPGERGDEATPILVLEDALDRFDDAFNIDSKDDTA